MRHTRLGTLVPAFALVLALAASVWADCADFISTGINDGPATGWLLGTEMQTTTEYELISAGTNGSVGASSTNVGGSTTVTKYKSITRTYQVGTYRMSDGTTWSVDCSSYTRI